MNALDLLRNEHRRISTLIQEVETELDPTTGQAPGESFEKLTRELRFHKRMLHECLYPDLEPFPEFSAYLALDSKYEREVEELVTSLEHNQPPEQGWTNRVAELRELWQTHVARSESRMFPDASRLLGPTRLQQLQFEMDALRTHQSDLDSAIYPASRLGPRS